MEHNDTRGRIPRNGWWTRLLDMIDERVSRRIDDDARRRGWTVTVGPGRVHTYRDPRWDSRHACEECRGTGCLGARPCDWCDGVGVVTERPGRRMGEAS